MTVDELHDAHGLLAGLGDALDVLPPEINRDENGERAAPKSSCRKRWALRWKYCESSLISPRDTVPRDTPLIGPVRM